MREEIRKYGKYYDNADIGSYIVCKDCGEKIKKYIHKIMEHSIECTYQLTEDADFEIIEPLQLPESKK